MVAGPFRLFRRWRRAAASPSGCASTMPLATPATWVGQRLRSVCPRPLLVRCVVPPAPQLAALKPDEAALPAVATLDSLNSTVADEIGSAISNCGGHSPLRKLKKKKQPKKKKTTKPQSISDHMPKDTLPEGTEKVCAPCSLPTSVCRYMYPPPPSLRLGCEPACPCTGCVPVVCQHCQ